MKEAQLHAPVSIIIPTLNSATHLGPTLASLKPGLDIGLIRELVLCDGGSSDATQAIGEELGAEWIEAEKGRGQQLGAGANAARGAWLLFLHSDSRLDETWAENVKNHLAHPDQAGFFRLRFDANGMAPRIVENWANLRARWFDLPYGDQGLLISRNLYDKLGGYAPLPLMEDVDIAQKLKGQLTSLNAQIVTSATRYEKAGWFRQGARNLQRLVRFKSGVPVERLMQDYKTPD